MQSTLTQPLRNIDYLYSENAFKATLSNKNMGFGKSLLSEKEQIVVNLTARKKEVSRKDVEKALNASQTMAGRIIKQLVNKGVIQAVGGGKNTRYISRQSKH